MARTRSIQTRDNDGPQSTPAPAHDPDSHQESEGEEEHEEQSSGLSTNDEEGDDDGVGDIGPGHQRHNPPADDTTQWNAMIPLMARTIPTGHVVPSGVRAITTPVSDVDKVSQTQANIRLATVRLVLGSPVGFSDALLKKILKEAAYDIGATLRRGNEIMNDARDRDQVQRPGRSLAQTERDHLLGADVLHHNRRRGVNALYNRLSHEVRCPPLLYDHWQHALLALLRWPQKRSHSHDARPRHAACGTWLRPRIR